MSAANTEFADCVARVARYGLITALTEDPASKGHFPNTRPREVRSGHYVSVATRPLPAPQYVAHSPRLLRDTFGSAGFPDVAASSDPTFRGVFTGDLSVLSELRDSDGRPLRTAGWSTGYALSIMGREMYSQCPFGNGNGYGDGRAASVLEIASSAPSQSWEFQLKGSGPTPYCRGGDGRAVLRSSVREFLVSEAMHRLRIPTTRGLCLFRSTTETVKRPWYSEGSRSAQPDILVDEPTAIATRVAPCFVRIGQLELHGRRARKEEHPRAMLELVDLVAFAADREYAAEIGTAPAHGLNRDDSTGKPSIEFAEHCVAFAKAVRRRLIDLVVGWIRVGYCQGNFNCDNCAVGGRTLDYGPFGFVELFDAMYQPWAGGGNHYALMGQVTAAHANFKMLCVALMPIIRAADPKASENDEGEPSGIEASLIEVLQGFGPMAEAALDRMLAAKLGLSTETPEAAARAGALVKELFELMSDDVPTDFTIFFRELAWLPLPADAAQLVDVAAYTDELTPEDVATATDSLRGWLEKWHEALQAEHGPSVSEDGFEVRTRVMAALRAQNPKYVPREWMLVKAYRAAIDNGDYSVVRELQKVFDNPYDDEELEDTPFGKPTAEERAAFAAKYYRRAPQSARTSGGIAVMT